ncbi:MAG: hypothetical protein K6U10_01150 [Acidobacteriia bacterium]|nr:hypothetical protein [Methyloceanibacter sp.]MCL6490410.1 hypothetical protein [Terriglobia bacterium]
MDTALKESLQSHYAHHSAGARSVHWRLFLRPLAEQIDAVAGVTARDDLLRRVGRGMAALLPLPPARTLGALEMEMNDALAESGWGSVRLLLDEEARTLRIVHVGLPRIGSAGTPPGTWLSCLLEGLYTAWMAAQPGSDPNLAAKIQQLSAGDTIVLAYKQH